MNQKGSCILPAGHGILRQALSVLTLASGSWRLTAESGRRRLSLVGSNSACQHWEIDTVGPRLGDVLVDAGRLCQAELEWALRAQRHKYQGRFRLGRVLYDLGLLEPKQIASARQLQLSLAVFEVNYWCSGSIEVEVGLDRVSFDRRGQGAVEVDRLATLEGNTPMIRRVASVGCCGMDLAAVPPSYRLERDLVYRYRDSLDRVVGEIPFPG